MSSIKIKISKQVVHTGKRSGGFSFKKEEKPLAMPIQMYNIPEQVTVERPTLHDSQMQTYIHRIGKAVHFSYAAKV